MVQSFSEEFFTLIKLLPFWLHVLTKCLFNLYYLLSSERAGTVLLCTEVLEHYCRTWSLTLFFTT